MGQGETQGVDRRGYGWRVALLLLCVTAGLLAVDVQIFWIKRQRLQGLQIEAQRKSLEIRAVTLDGRLMGAVTLMGVADPALRRQARPGPLQADPALLERLRTLGTTFRASSCFAVDQNGTAKLAWDNGGRPATGLDLSFRPYFKMAMKGHASVYAAVRLKFEERVLYFAAPIMDESGRSAIGAIVGRTDLESLDSLLTTGHERTLLVSPQGVVFASNQAKWIGNLVGEADANRLEAIRRQRQFGSMFDRRDPQTLPFSTSPGIQTVEGRSYAIATADVDWSDPSGPWRLVLMDDLGASLPTAQLLMTGAAAAVLALALSGMALRLHRARQALEKSNEQLRAFAVQQGAEASFRTVLSELASRLHRCETLAELGEIFLKDARDMAEVMQGAVYATAQDPPCRIILVAASAAASSLPAEVALGQDLIGQCALDRRRIVLEAPPRGPWLLRSGLGQCQPEVLMMIPLIQRDELVGVVELALARRLDAEGLARLDRMLAVLTNGMEILRRNERAWLPLSADGVRTQA